MQTKAALNNYLSFLTAGSATQFVLTETFGGVAEVTLKLSEFSSDETIQQIEDIGGEDTVTATAKVLNNFGWIQGPNILRVHKATGKFKQNARVLGEKSRSSGVINTIISAEGFGDIGAVSRLDGRFFEETGKLSSLSQKIQSEFYQNFSYFIESGLPSTDWKESVLSNLHPLGFSLFSQYNYVSAKAIKKPTGVTSFARNISLDVANSRRTKDFSAAFIEDALNVNEVTLIDQELITSENIITSFVEKCEDISDQFDGVEKTFDLTVQRTITNTDGSTSVQIDPVRTNKNFTMVYLNDILQSREAYNLANGRITFTEAPKSSLISKSRDVFLSGVYPSTAAFSDDEQLAVVRVYEIILDDTNIRSQYLEITNADEDAFAVGSPLTQHKSQVLLQRKLLQKSMVLTSSINSQL